MQDNPEEYPKHLQSDQFVTVWRGLAHSSRRPKINYNELGVHWAGEQHNHYAPIFAERHFDTAWDEDDPSGTIIKARVHKSGIPYDNDEEWEQLTNVGDGAYEPENEIPVRPATPVHIVGLRRSYPEKDRTFTFKNPRVGRA